MRLTEILTRNCFLWTCISLNKNKYGWSILNVFSKFNNNNNNNNNNNICNNNNNNNNDNNMIYLFSELDYLKTLQWVTSHQGHHGTRSRLCWHHVRRSTSPWTPESDPAQNFRYVYIKMFLFYFMNWIKVLAGSRFIMMHWWRHSYKKYTVYKNNTFILLYNVLLLFSDQATI